MASKLLTLIVLVIAVCASPVTAQTSTLPHGVAAGDADQTSVVLWARSEHTGTVVFELATDATFAAVSTTLTAEVSDPLIPVKVDVTGLTAGTTYFYRATDAAGVIGNGTFRTLHAPGARFVGAAVVVQPDSTTFIPVGWAAEVDTYYNLILEKIF